MPSSKNLILKEDKTASVQGAQTLHRAIHLLKLVASNNKKGIRLTDIAQDADLTTPTTHRLLKALLTEGLIHKVDNSNLYELGPLVYELGLTSKLQFSFIDFCKPIIKILAHKTAGTMLLLVNSDEDVTCILKKEGAKAAPIPNIFEGKRQALGLGAGGLSMLAALSKSKAEKIIEANTHRFKTYADLSPSQMRDLIKTTQEKGYALLKNHEASNIIGLGVPILNHKGFPVGSIAVLTPEEMMTEEYLAEVLNYFNGGVREITQLLGQKETLWDI